MITACPVRHTYVIGPLARVRGLSLFWVEVGVNVVSCIAGVGLFGKNSATPGERGAGAYERGEIS
jgi:hypothetical protein